MLPSFLKGYRNFHLHTYFIKPLQFDWKILIIWMICVFKCNYNWRLCHKWVLGFFSVFAKYRTYGHNIINHSLTPEIWKCRINWSSIYHGPLSSRWSSSWRLMRSAVTGLVRITKSRRPRGRQAMMIMLITFFYHNYHDRAALISVLH